MYSDPKGQAHQDDSNRDVGTQSSKCQQGGGQETTQWKLGLDSVPDTSRNLCFPLNLVETLSIQKKNSIQFNVKMGSQGEMNPVQHENGLEWIKFLIPYLNIPVKEIITNWIDELLGLAAA